MIKTTKKFSKDEDGSNALKRIITAEGWKRIMIKEAKKNKK